MLWRTGTVHLWRWSILLRLPLVAHRDGAPPEVKRPAPPPTLVTG